MTLIFLNGGGMRGGPLHHQIQGAALVRPAISAPKYRYFSVADRFPAMQEVATGGVAVHGELYDVPLEVLRDHLIPAEPPELELGIIELDDGTACLATVLRRATGSTPALVDISSDANWRTYQAIQQLSEADLTDCLAAPTWVRAMLANRPYPDTDTVLATARAAADALTLDEVRAALDSHPRIGERPTASTRSASWSRGEQAKVTPLSDILRAANARYERQFGHIYLVCATNKTDTQILANLKSRLPNPPDTELAIARNELRSIAILRLTHLLRESPLQDRESPATREPELTTRGGGVGTHVLDAVSGIAAQGVAVRLETAGGDVVDTGWTDADGRIRELGADQATAGVYRLRFDTGGYFADQGLEGFYPEVVVTFRITDAMRHHHVPVLLSPFAYSTYRGS